MDSASHTLNVLSPSLTGSTGTRSADILTPRRFAVLLFALLLVAYPKIILGTGTFYVRDFGVLGYPTLFYHHECFWRGEWPSWIPLNHCGAPYLAQWGTMALYPFSLIYLLLPMPWSLNWFSILHLMLAGMGMYWLAFRWTGNRLAASIAGIGYVFNGATISSLIWPNYLVAIGWMPFVVWLVERAWKEGGKWIAGAALVGALQMLSGVPELIAATWLLVTALCLAQSQREVFWRQVTRLAVIVVAVCALSAAQLLPFFELLKHSPRGQFYDIARWTMPGSGWANLILPLFQTRPGPLGFFYQPAQQFMLTYYGGMFLVLFAACAAGWKRERRTFILLGALLFVLVFALGSKGHLYDWIRLVVPQIGFARYTIKAMSLCAFVLPLLAAIAIAAIMERREWRLRNLAVPLAALFAVVAALLWFDHAYPMTRSNWTANWHNSVLRVAFCAAAVALLYSASRIKAVRAQAAIQAGLVALVAVDLITHAPNIAPTVPATTYLANLWPARFSSLAPQLADHRAMLSAGAHATFMRKPLADPQTDLIGKRMGLYLNLNLLDGISKVDGAMTLLVKEQDDVEALLYSQDAPEFPRLMDFLGAAVTTDRENIAEWVHRPSAMPLVTGGQRPVFLTSAEILPALAAPEFDPRAVVYLSAEDKTRVHVQGVARVEVKEPRFHANRVTATVEADAPALVVLSQTFYPCWRAFVDGKPADILRANHAFQAIEVPAGAHRLELRYRDVRFIVGGGISLLALGACVVYLWLQHKAKPRIEP